MIKRLFDVAIAIVLLVALSPVLLVAAIAVRIVLGSSVFFVQSRPGLNGRPFRMYKLRTMANLHGADGVALADGQRLGKLGRFLRATSIDELPELLNVVLGDMSLVGPRPLLMQYLPRYTPEQMRRHEVRPGITGWAQVNGRNAIDWPQRLALDVWYVDNHSLLLDLKILWMTVFRVAQADGISQAGQATMSEFRGAGSAGSEPATTVRDNKAE